MDGSLFMNKLPKKSERKVLYMDVQKNSVAKRMLAVVLALAMLATMSVPVAFAAPETMEKWHGMYADEILIKDTISRIADGVTEHEVITNNPKGNDQKIDYMCFINISDTIKIEACYGKDDASKWGMYSTTQQAKYYEEKHPGETVVAGINADFFNMGTGEPLGALVMEGEVKHDYGGRWYFAVLKDGTPVIRNTPDLSDCYAAVGGLAPLVYEGNLCPENYPMGTDDYSRCTIGIMKDGTVCTAVTYGRLNPISCGRTYEEIAEMYYNQGCEYALVLDGGGSSTFAAKLEGSDDFVVRNHPSDGAEREVSSTLLIVSKATQTGIFDHAVLEPNNLVYTPGSEVAFTAAGVDTAGFTMDLPEGTAWALAEDSAELGTIDPATGVFTAGTTEGTVTVNLMLEDAVVGSTTIDIATPDQISYKTEEISLGFEAVTDLNIVVRSKGRDIIYKEGDLIWSTETEGLGTFEGNSFIANPANSLNGDVTVTSAFDEEVKGTIHVIVGMLPSVVFDFEDVTDPETGVVTPASEYYIQSAENPTGILSTSNYARGGKESIEIASIDDDEPVRFGSHSLKINFDFTDCGAVTEGACIGSLEGNTIPGTPTGLGVWVYAPDGVGVDWPNVLDDDGNPIAGLWLRAYVQNGGNTRSEVNYTFEPKQLPDLPAGTQPGIYWKGWKYLEADLTGFQAPFSIEPGMTFRLMFVNGTNMIGTQRSGSIYMDNFQFVYGTNVDDTDNPVVDSILANDEELVNGAELTTGDISITAKFSDVQNKYTTGVDKTLSRIYVDGINTCDNEDYMYENGASQFQIKDETEAYLYDLSLEDGTHTVSVVIRDGFGNETTETREFTVNTGKTADHSKVTVEAVEEKAILGKTVNINIYADGNDIARSETILKLNNLFKKYTVTYSDNYEGTDSFSNLSENITVKATRKAEATAEDGNLIATVAVEVPTSLAATNKLNYTVVGGCYETLDGVYQSYYVPTRTLSVDAAYKLSVKNVVTGMPTIVEVLNNDGTPAEGVQLYYASNGAAIEGAVSDAEGKIVTEAFSGAQGSTVIFAKDEEGLLSFQATVYTFNPATGDDPTPYGVMFNFSEKNATEKRLSWYSNIKTSGEQFIKYAPAGTEDWTEVKATQKEVTYTKGTKDSKTEVVNSAVYVNTVTITGLSPESEYDYIVGGGDYWTEKATFSTNKEEITDADFFVLGDIQAADTTNIDAIMEELKKTKYDFGIQTGDTVDDTVNYGYWMDVIDLFGANKLGDTDMLHVLGNHEYAGDALAERSAAVYDLGNAEPGSHYSVTYGDVYIAVINYTGTAQQLEKALEWLVKDAAASDAQWKVLCMHQPAYYSNAVGGNAEIFNLVPAAVDEAGINVVFSGHDHSVARTNQLTNNEVDEENGTLYYICGSSGEKSYDVSSQEIFDYDKIFAYAPSIDYTAIYLTAHADKHHMTININDIENGLLDTITLDSSCVRNGHTEYFDPAVGKVVCSECGDTNDTFTGEINDLSNNTYYLINGVLQTGWTAIGSDIFYYNKTTGIKEEVTKTTDIPTTCLTRGYYVLTSASGATKQYNYAQAPGHSFVLQDDGSYVCSECQYRRIEMSECTVKLPYKKMTYTGSARTQYPTITDPNGTKMVGFSETTDKAKRDFMITYSNNVEVGTAAINISAYSGYYYINVKECRSRYGGEVVANYDIVPDVPTGLTAAITGNEAVLEWTASKAAASCPITYTVYASADNGKTWKKLGTSETTSFTAKDLAANTTYTFRVNATGKVEGKDYVSIGYSATASAATLNCFNLEDATIIVKSAAYTGEAITPEFSVVYNGTTLTPEVDYTAEFTNNTEAGFGTVTVTGVANCYGTNYVDFLIAPQDFSNIATAVADTAEVTYNKEGATNTFTVTLEDGTVLAADKDYTVSYENNTTVGTATATITGKGNYTGTVTAEFTVAELEGHILSERAATPATCTETGVKACYVCEICGKLFSDAEGKVEVTEEDLVVKALRHVWGEFEYNWEETEDGFTCTRTRACLRNDCDATDTDTAEVTAEVITPATCETDGETVYTATFTGDEAAVETNDVVVPATGHEWSVTEYEWILTDDGFTVTASCSCPNEGCNIGEVKETVTAAYEVTLDPTCTEDGTAKYTAEFESDLLEATEKEVVLKATGHSYVDGACAFCGKLDAPVLTVTNVSSTGYPKLTWDAVKGAVSYKIYRATSEDGTYKLMLTKTETSYINTSAVPGTTYFYKVVAVNDDTALNSDKSAAVSAICKCAAPEVTGSSTAVNGYPKLTWNAVEGAVSYKVYRSTEQNGTYKLMFTTEKCEYTNTSAVAGTKYYYKVKAVPANAEGTSAYSNRVLRTCDYAKPVVTAGLSAAGKPELRWNTVEGATGYKVYRSTTKDGEFKLIKTVTAGKFTNTSAVKGTTYYYKVRAIGDNAEAASAYSAVKTIKSK